MLEGPSLVRNARGLRIKAGRVRELSTIGLYSSTLPGSCFPGRAVSGVSVRLWYYALRKTEAH